DAVRFHAATEQGDGKNAIIGVRHEGRSPPHDNPPNFSGGVAVNRFQDRAGPALSASYTILWCAEAVPPDVAVNEFRQGGVSDSGAIRSRLVPQLKHRTQHRPFPGRYHTDSLVLGDGRSIDAQTASPERSRRLVRRHALHRLRRRAHGGARTDRRARRAIGVRTPAANGGRANDGMARAPSLPDRFGADRKPFSGAGWRICGTDDERSLPPRLQRQIRLRRPFVCDPATGRQCDVGWAALHPRRGCSTRDWGGLSDILLTHRDDVGDAERYG